MIGFKIFGLVLLFSIIGYLFGNILFGILISKIKKIDLRNQGSGNVGATNTLRIMGKSYGVIVLLLDFFKSILACMISTIIYSKVFFLITNNNEMYTKFGFIIYFSSFFAIIGHCFPIIYLFSLFKNKFNFKESSKQIGGKGVATAAGFIASLSPWLFLICFIVFFVIVFTTRYVSLSSILTCFVIPIFVFVPHLCYLYMLDLASPKIMEIPCIANSLEIAKYINYTNNYLYMVAIILLTLLASFIVIYRHKSNICRLIKHEEKKIF